MKRKYLIRVLDLLALIVTLGFWYQLSGEQLSEDLPSQLVAYGRLFGLLASLLVLKQLLLIGRVKWIESSYGFDRLTREHAFNGGLLYFLILFHVLFLLFGYAELNELSLGEQLSKFVFKIEDVGNAVVALFLLTVVVYISSKKYRIKYEVWYWTHLLVYLAIPLSFGHPLEAGHDLSTSVQFSNFWLGLYGFVVANFVLYRFLAPLYYYFKHGFRVEKVVKETDEVHSVYISAKNLAKYRIKAGQFLIMRFIQKGMRREAHPFSLSCEPNNDYLRITVKNVGDYTSKIKTLVEGTKVLIDGPHGIFTSRLAKTGDILLIAGGIGITPLRALAEQFLKERKHVALMYCHRFEKDGVFIEELNALAAEHGLQVFHVISRGEVTIGEKGRVSKGRIRRLIPDVAKRDCYICGPTEMMKDTIKALLALDVPKERINYERFAL